MVGDAVIGLPADQVDRVVADVDEAEPLLLRRGVGVAEDERHVDLAGP